MRGTGDVSGEPALTRTHGKYTQVKGLGPHVPDPIVAATRPIHASPRGVVAAELIGREASAVTVRSSGCWGTHVPIAMRVPF